MTSAVIVIDVQNCFLPGGSLATGNSRNATIPAKGLAINIAKFINTKSPEHIFISKDWHTPGHTSFISAANTAAGKMSYPSAAEKGEFAKGIAQARYSGKKFITKRSWGVNTEREDQKLWPEHCVQGTPGADVDASLLSTLSADNKAKAVTILKGDSPDIDSYSVVADALGSPTPHDESGNSFLSILQKSDITTVYLTGIARDVCVFWSALDLLNFWILPAFRTGKKIKLVFKYDLTRPVSPVPGAPYTDKTPEQIMEAVAELIWNMKFDPAIINEVFAIEMGDYNAIGGRKSKNTKKNSKKNNKRRTMRR